MAALTELVAQRDELKGRIGEIDSEYTGKRFTDEAKDEWNRLNSELDELNATIDEIQARHQRVSDLDEAGKVEKGVEFHTRKATRAENPYDLSDLRRNFDPAGEAHELKERGKRILDGAVIAEMGVDGDIAKRHVEKLAERLDGDTSAFSRYMVATDNPVYKRAFPKLLSPNGAAMLSREEQFAVGQVQAAQRALSLTTASGGFVVPFTLDPTIIPTSNLAVNPFRAVSRVENIVTDDWNGVTSAGVTASWDAEGAEVSDDSPTVAQPSVSVHKAAAFVTGSIEIFADWAGLQQDMAQAIQDAKDELEATAFATGSGSGQPQGVITGATATVTSATGGAFAAADVYALENNLPPRFRPMASFVANRAIANRIRQFDTAGGAQLWVDNLRVGLDNQVPAPGRLSSNLLGYGAYESSAMTSTVTTGQKPLIMGDFRYFLIADRIGLTLEYIPHMFHTSNNRPSGSRGIYAYWRTGAGVLSTNAFRVLQL